MYYSEDEDGVDAVWNRKEDCELMRIFFCWFALYYRVKESLQSR